ncbi:hypothetical protein ACI799_10310 [Blastococcus sp. SYSU DS0753]
MKRWLTWTALAVTGLLLTLLAYGTFVEPRLILDTEREDVALPRLGHEWTGTEVALVADLQIGMWLANVGMVERAVDRIVEEQPDVVLLGGDFIYGEDSPPGPRWTRSWRSSPRSWTPGSRPTRSSATTTTTPAEPTR